MITREVKSTLDIESRYALSCASFVKTKGGTDMSAMFRSHLTKGTRVPAVWLPVLTLVAAARLQAAEPPPQCADVCKSNVACGTACSDGAASTTCGAAGPTCTEQPIDRARTFLFSFRMLTLNTWLLSTPLGIEAAPDRPCRARQIGDRLASHFYDVVLLQEGFDEKNVNNLIARAAYPYRFSRYPRPKGLEMSGGLAFLSVFPVSFQHNEPWDDAAGPDAFAQKGFFHARLRHPSMDSPLDFVTLHLNANYGSPFTFQAVRRNQLLHLEDELARYGRSTLLVAGDFNVVGPPMLVGDAATNAEYQQALRAILAPTLKDAWIPLRSKLPGFTSDDCVNTYLSGCAQNSEHRKRIDMLFYDDERNCYELELADVLVDEFREAPGTGCPKDHLSDHFGLGAVFNVWRKSTSDFPACLPPDPDHPGDVR